ncbi:MAG: class I SAM-dependent methyltransferase [Rhizobiaceae bacterium]
MTRDASKTLFHPFDTGDLPPPGEDSRVLFLGPEPGFRLPEGFAGRLALVQGFRPWFNALKNLGHDVSTTTEGGDYDLCLVLAGRHRGENERRVAEAVARVRAGGTVLVAGSRDDGIATLRKTVERLAGLDGAVPKYHGVAFWFRRPDDGAAFAALAAGNAGKVVENRFRAAPGMFSHERVDAGSRLLAAHLPVGAKGAAADFGAGWGFLAAMLAERSPGLSRIDLYEADHQSLEAARENLSGMAFSPFGFHWHDLVGETVRDRYDLIVMNPPFHQGRAAEPDIGKAMIAAAAGALKPGGRLYMVANRGLPYGKVLAEKFKEVAELAREGGFQVFSARR